MSEDKVAGDLIELLGSILMFLAPILIIIIIIFVAQAIFLNKLSKLKTGKKSVAAWIPIGNIYAVGKITINKWIGIILLIVFLLSGRVTLTNTSTFNGVTEKKKVTLGILPESIGNITRIIILGLYIYAIYQYIILKKKQKEPNHISNKNNIGMTNDDSSINNNSVELNSEKTENDNIKNDFQDVVNEPSVSLETLSSTTENNNNTQQTKTNPDSDTSALRDLYR